MLDENLPTYRLQPSSDSPRSTILYFTHRGSEPSPEYQLQRDESARQYALGLLDVHQPSVVYGEVVVSPEWTQPTLSAAELRNTGAGAAAPTAIVPDAFTILLYNPDQSVVVKRTSGGWGKSESWDFEVPSQTFKPPSASELDRRAVPGLEPKVLFRWKRDGRLSRDMTCYMCGRSVGGTKSKEPDITVALYRCGKTLTVYEPNMARVEVQDRKGLEVVLVLSAEVVRDMYLAPRHDLFNTAAAEALRMEREQRDAKEQRRIREMLDKEEQERRRQVDLETERLRKQYGVQPQNNNGNPALPPRPSIYASGALPAPTTGPAGGEVTPPGKKRHTLGGFFHRHDDDRKRSL